jgi:thiaminase/transcriptional activator TenA
MVVAVSGSESTSVPETFEEYAEDKVDARFTDWLRERTEPDWTDATSHRFACELGSGELDEEVFRRYLVQDYAFVGTLIGTFGHAVGEAPTMEAKSQLVDFLGVLTDDEDDYFERSFGALDVPETEYADPNRTPTTRTFEDLLERAGREGGYAETLAVLVPAEWVYLAWATDLAGENPSRFYLAEWIDLHAGETFENFVSWLRGQLDCEGAEASPRRQLRLDRLFRRTMELEVAFFESAYDPEEPVLGGNAR